MARKRKNKAKSNPLIEAVGLRDASTMDIVGRAISQGNAMLAFQPVVFSRQPGRVAFHEGLIRLMDDAGRIIPARDFISEVDQTELGRELDCVALRQGFEALAQEPSLRLSINLSARSIGYPKWMRILNRRLDRDPTLGQRLILEISETSTTQVPDLVSSFMSELRQRDITFALDDFGSGLTAFRHFRAFQFDIVKIDGQFIRNLCDDPDNQVITRAMVAMAKQLDMFCVAENVERSVDAEFLTEIGVDCLQGYLYAAPSLTPPWQQEDDRQMA